MGDFIVLPLYLFPPKAYFSIVKKHEVLVINDLEVYRKQSLRNHFDILTSQGRLMITFPVKKPWREIPVKDIKIDWSQKFISNHWKSIQTAYGKSPFFEHYDFLIKNVIEKKNPFLLDLNIEALKLCQKCLSLRFEIIFASDSEEMEPKTSSEELSRTQMMNWDEYFSKESDELTYRQHFGNDFVDRLSVLDLIFNHGPESSLYI